MSKDIQINDRTYNDISTVTVTTTSGNTANFYDSSTTTATSSEIVSGKTAVLKNGMTTGTMSDNGTISGEIKTKDESVSVPSGYYSGNGSVSIADTEKAKLVANNIRHGVSILGVEGTMKNGTTIVSGSGEMTFDTVADMVNNGTNNVSDGTPVKCLGYYKKNDDGGAQYVVKYIHSTELASYPWAIDLGELPEYENQIEYNLDKTPKRDENGDYIYTKDSTGKTIALTSKKHLYSVINETTVNYSQFGAKLDGTTDDYQSIYLAHKYQHDHYTIESYSGRRRYYIKVENHKGIIHKDNDEPIVCSGNIDLSGSQLLITDKNATWFGFYLWGDND